MKGFAVSKVDVDMFGNIIVREGARYDREKKPTSTDIKTDNGYKNRRNSEPLNLFPHILQALQNHNRFAKMNVQ